MKPPKVAASWFEEDTMNALWVSVPLALLLAGVLLWLKRRRHTGFGQYWCDGAGHAGEE